MADNATLPATGSVIATDDIAGVHYQIVKLCLGAMDANNGTVSSVNPLPVSLGLQAISTTVALTRPNDTAAYGANNAIGATSTTSQLTFSNVGTAGKCIQILDGYIHIYLAALPSGMTRLRLHLYNALPSNIGDHSGWDISTADRSKYLGFIEFPTPEDMGSSLFCQLSGINKIVQLVDGNLYGILVTVGAFTGAAQTVHNITLSTVRRQCPKVS